MNLKKKWAVLLLACSFSFLFFYPGTGINLLIFDLILVFLLYQLLPAVMKGRLFKVLVAGMFLSSVFTVIHHTYWNIVMHHISVFLLGGALAVPESRNLAFLFPAGVLNVAESIKNWITDLRWGKEEKNPHRRRFFYYLRIAVIPVIAVLIFSNLYAGSSPWFNTLWEQAVNFVSTILSEIFEIISIRWLFTLLFGLAIAVYILYATQLNGPSWLGPQKDELLRKRERFTGNFTALKREHHVAITLFAVLNFLLLAQNILDIQHVWIGFSWNGEYLKQFVHEGTYLLIFSIILSAALVLFYFRANLNFLQNNRALKILAATWLLQNAVLAFSVAVRNYWYIQYFNLAYKRIGVFFFLIAVVYGLFTVYRKVHQRKSNFFLVRKNALFGYGLLLCVGLVNWDIVIARYNFLHTKAYIHLSFLMDRSDAALPYLDIPVDELERLNIRQEKIYGPGRDDVPAEEYAAHISRRIKEFRSGYTKRHWLAWNYADWNSYHMLQNKEKDFDHRP